MFAIRVDPGIIEAAGMLQRLLSVSSDTTFRDRH